MKKFRDTYLKNGLVNDKTQEVILIDKSLLDSILSDWINNINEAVSDDNKSIELNGVVIKLHSETEEGVDPSWLLKQWIIHFFGLKEAKK